MKNLCQMHYCLSLEVWRDDGRTLITQRKYTNQVLKIFHMNWCKVASTPLEQNIKLRSEDETKELNGTLDQHLVGSLNYLTTTRPYIAYPVSILSEFMAKPRESHWIAAKRVLWYLKGTINFGIKYTNSCNVELTSHFDSDWVRNLNDRKSTTEYVFNIGSRAISRSNKKQQTDSLWSTEVEYKALCSATCEAIWLRIILEDVSEGKKEPIVIKSDNQSTVNLGKNLVCHAWSKHIKTQYHFGREKFKSKEIDLIYCNTNENVADILTKPLVKEKFEFCRSKLCVVENPDYVVSLAKT